jgi:regulator of sigma E protease
MPNYVTTTVKDVYLEEQTAFEVGDQVVKCDGYGVLNYTDLKLAIHFIEHETFDATVIRNGERVELTDIPLIMTEDGYRIGISFGVEDMNFGKVLTQTATESLSIVRSVWKSLAFLVTGRVGIGELSGPVGITAMIGETVQYGILNVLNLVALIAMNLGVMNLLPIPALDGGRILFVLVEAVIGKPIPPEKEGIVHLVGFGLLMLLTVFVFINDIIRVVT